jgi:branched-chain amino acid transport system ATP-binding protein
MTGRLEVAGLTKRFGGLVAVRDVSLTAEVGQVTAIIGPNGAGKTTLFNCITGFYKPDRGQVRMVHGGSTVRIDRRPTHAAARLGLARTFQNIRLFPAMTVLENMLVAQHGKLMKASAYSLAGILSFPGYVRVECACCATAASLLDRFGLLDRADLPAGALPYGDQRRLEIARALATSPRYLFLDEPAAGLNPRETEQLSTSLAGLHADFEIGIVLIEHDMGLVMKIANAIHVLDHGELIASGTPAEIRSDARVIAAYLGEPEPMAFARISVDA